MKKVNLKKVMEVQAENYGAKFVTLYLDDPNTYLVEFYKNGQIFYMEVTRNEVAKMFLDTNSGVNIYERRYCW